MRKKDERVREQERKMEQYGNEKEKGTIRKRERNMEE